MDVEKNIDTCNDPTAESPSTPFLSVNISDRPHYRPVRQTTSLLHWIGHLVCLLVIAVLLTMPMRRSNLDCWDRFNTYTPMRNFIRDHPYVSQAMNGSKRYQSEFVGTASTETEKSWRSATEYGLLGLTREEIAKVGYPDWSAQFPPSAREDQSYPVVVVGNHQLHCLHYIWQDHHLDYYTSRAVFKAENPALYEGHYEHCVDFLRQRLMCHYDMSVTPYQWVAGVRAPMPGATTNEKCVDWEAMREWMRDNTPETEEGFVWVMPTDAVTLDRTP